MSKLQIIVGSTRPTRAVDQILPWLVERTNEHEGFAVEVLDLRDWPLPMFQEHAGTIGDLGDPTFSDPIVKRWNTKIAEGDAYLMVTPEYNHSVPAVLKNAIDSVFITHGLRNKPMTTVSYSGGAMGGVRAIEHLAAIAVECEMAPLRSTVIVGNVGAAFGEDGQPVDPLLDVNLQIALDDLAWWSHALEVARAGGELAPGKFRAAAARRALAANAP
jgi:NAD(P)H-dependent FMN reductase